MCQFNYSQYTSTNKKYSFLTYKCILHCSVKWPILSSLTTYSKYITNLVENLCLLTVIVWLLQEVVTLCCMNNCLILAGVCWSLHSHINDTRGPAPDIRTQITHWQCDQFHRGNPSLRESVPPFQWNAFRTPKCPGLDIYPVGTNAHKKVVFRQTTYRWMDHTVVMCHYRQNCLQWYHLRKYEVKSWVDCVKGGGVNLWVHWNWSRL